MTTLASNETQLIDRIEEVGAKLRDKMPWNKKGALVDKTKN